MHDHSTSRNMMRPKILNSTQVHDHVY